MNSVECSLEPLDSNYVMINIINLTTLGRCLNTGIVDKLLSRNQALFEPDFEKKELKITQIGKFPSKANNNLLNIGESSTLKDGDIYMFLDNKYTYKVKFTIKEIDKTLNQKRKLSDDANTSPKKLKQNCWTDNNGMLIYTPCDLIASAKIASYDIDGTIITTKSGKVFAKDLSDWKLIYPQIKSSLKDCFNDGYKIVFFTNQMGIAKGKIKLSDFQNKVENILKELDIPIQVFVSISTGIYRKPATGMWDYMTEKMNDKLLIDKNKSFYIGDAAGRPKDWTKSMKKDFSCGDRLFALNIGIKFETPEEHFLKMKPAKYNLPDFKPFEVANLDPSTTDSLTLSLLKSKKKEMIIMVGFPGSGKSHFVKSHLIPAGYVHINRDTIKTWQACVEKSREALSSGHSVAIDNTNPDIESRKRYIQVAIDASVTCRCFIMNVSFEHAKHNEKFREITDSAHEHVSDMVFNIYKSKYHPPNISEGFSEIIEINFLPAFKSRSDYQLYKQYLLEK